VYKVSEGIITSKKQKTRRNKDITDGKKNESYDRQLQVSFSPNKGSHVAGDYSVIASHKIVASGHGDNTDVGMHKDANHLRLTWLTGE
jgi:hypothetical protein